ncbi:MAG: hypothetical protein ACOYBD_08830 [Bilifractor sp.]|jgi:hypothetical protein
MGKIKNWENEDDENLKVEMKKSGKITRETGAWKRTAIYKLP